ncbi:MAG: hypothetical protein JWP12_1969 [Bacteroidetes bacterium]|nr:hypothetical protein [Bacteroidota bacterium]
MKIQKIIFFISAFIFISSCTEHAPVALAPAQTDSSVTANRITFPDHTAPSLDSNYVILHDDDKAVLLSITEIKEIDSLMTAYIKTNKLDLENLSDYKRQYFPSYNDKNEKVIWVNYFCDDPDNWKKSMVMVDDGGNCYFQFKINLSKKKIYDFMVNGNA